MAAAITLHFDVIDIEPPDPAYIRVSASGPAVVQRAKDIKKLRGITEDTVVVLGDLDHEGRWSDDYAFFLGFSEQWIIERIPNYLKEAAWKRRGNPWGRFLSAR